MQFGPSGMYDGLIELSLFMIRFSSHNKDSAMMAITSAEHAPTAAPSNSNAVLENLGDQKTSKKQGNSCMASTYMENTREL